MRLHFKEDPKEWRKATLLGLIGPSALAGILRWRGVVSWMLLAAALLFIALVALCACLRPRWFRGYYRFTTWLGFHLVEIFGKLLLTALFFLILTPLGWIMRGLRKDLLQLDSSPGKQTFWQRARQDDSLDRMY